MNVNTALSSDGLQATPELLATSYTHCEEVAKTQARNFYYSFVTLPPERRAAMCAIYAFMRYSDDVSDAAMEEGSRPDAMREWRQALDRALAGDYGDSLILPAFHDTVRKFNIPSRYFHELIDGVEMDLTKTRYETFAELHQYCYRVASVVGFVCIHIWGFDEKDPRSLQYAESCGLALQLTNILRDIKEDMERDRIYLPQEDMRRFGVTEDHLRRGIVDDRFTALMRFEVDRAEAFYKQADALFPLVNPCGRPTLFIMVKIYHGILDSILKQNFDVFSKRARVPTWKKLVIVLRARLQARFASKTGQVAR